MAKPKCGYCGKRVAKRYCSSLDKLICSQCCGENRLKNISCDQECRYLDNEVYQQKIRKEKELSTELKKIPHSETDDIFKEPDAKRVAYAFESFFAECYSKDLFNLTDQKIKGTLSDLYFHKIKGKMVDPDDFFSLTMRVYDSLKEEKEPESLICKVMLRIIISVKKMTGGPFGAYGYLNYVKNNLHPDMLGDNVGGHIIETKDGKRKIVKFGVGKFK
ncbi:MAG: hypothetical protein U9P07_03630 [Pseudomonadota bacterium]|nr:hypothetical protein [Pseudomonadota bacterium]